MATLPVLDKTGKQVGDYEIELSQIAPRINRQLLHDAVVMYQANLRRGSSKTKTRSEVAGSTKKMYRQKGTGHARAGSKRSPIRRGGGHAFAKQPRDFSYRLPKKALRQATKMALASRIEDEAIVVLDELSFAEPRTRDMFDVLKAVGAAGASALLAIEEQSVNVYKSARNIAGVSVSPVRELNAYSILKPRKIVVTRAALDVLCGRAAENRAVEDSSSEADQAAGSQETAGEADSSQ